MNRSQLEHKVYTRLKAKGDRITLREVEKVTEALIEEIIGLVCKGDVVRLHRFGKFVPRVRAGGHKPNPHTGEPMDFSERVSVAFLPGDRLRALLNKETGL